MAGLLVTMYVIDLIGRLDPDLSGLRYASVFKYYGNAIEDGIEPVAFTGVTPVACALTVLGCVAGSELGQAVILSYSKQLDKCEYR
jgi:beta-exotoxin I transport system permease protein